MKPTHRHREVSIAPAKPPVDVPGVSYEAVAGLRMFACEPLKARMTQGGCARRWREAQEATGIRAEEMTACRGCPIGASHAGEVHVHYARIYGAAICPRCRKGTTRMIRNGLCVGCYNRDRELLAGRNARGNIPVELLQRAPHTHEFRIVVDGRARRIRGRGVDLLEPMVQALRVTKGEVHFAFAGPVPPGLRQGVLW